MSRWRVGVAALCLMAGPVLAHAPAGPAKAGAKRAPAPGALQVTKVYLGVQHRAHEDFYDEVVTSLGVQFQVGDTDYSAKVLRFVPDFALDMDTRKVVSKSARPENPAFQVATWQRGVPHDTSWAFLNFPPHFSKKALLAFQVLRIEFSNHAPVTPKGAAPALAPPDSAARRRK